jgi:hypothetical protein
MFALNWKMENAKCRIKSLWLAACFPSVAWNAWLAENWRGTINDNERDFKIDVKIGHVMLELGRWLEKNGYELSAWSISTMPREKHDL